MFKSANKQTDIAEDCPDIELNGQSFEIVEKFCYFGGTIGVRGEQLTVFLTAFQEDQEWIE